MNIVLGNMGTFMENKTVGYFPEVKDGELTVTMLVGDGNGTVPVVVHKDNIDLNPERSRLFEGHARELLASMSGEQKGPVNCFHLANKLEHISARFDNSETPATVRALLTAAEGTVVVISADNTKGAMRGYPDVARLNRYEAAGQWMQYQKSQWRMNATVSLSDGVTKVVLDTIETKK